MGDDDAYQDKLKEDFMDMCKGSFRELKWLTGELHQREGRRIKLILGFERDHQRREEMRFEVEKRYQETIIDSMQSIFHLLKSETNQY